MKRCLAVRIIESIAVGLATACVFLLIDVEGVHTIVQPLSMLDIIVKAPAWELFFELQYRLGIATTAGLEEATEILSGTITYGAIAFVVLWFRDRRHRRRARAA